MTYLQAVPLVRVTLLALVLAACQEQASTSPAVRVTSQIFKRDGFGSVALHDLAIKNDRVTGLKDFHITCEYFGASGSVISSATRTLFDTLGPYEERKFADLNFGFVSSQASSARCRVISATEL